MQYYATATNDKGASFIINNLPESRVGAVNEAIKHCRKNNLVFQDVYPVKGTGRQNDTLTKTIEKKRGRKVYWPF